MKFPSLLLAGAAPVILFGLPIVAQDSPSPTLPAGLVFSEGPVNGVTIGGEIVVYRPAGDEDKPSTLLLTHSRRDLVEAARRGAGPGTSVIASALSKEDLEGAEDRWTAWWDGRYDNSEQQVTQWPVRSFPAARYVKDGDKIEVGGVAFKVLETPGFTRDGVTYLTEIEGKRIAFIGNLIWEGGRVFDLYSFQNAIPEAKVGNYHGYCGRFGPWIASLEKLAAEKPDFLIPSRGPIIVDPARDIARAIGRARAIYKNYISTNALHWYFGEERMRTSFEKVMGPGVGMEAMPLCEHVDLPAWCRHIGTTKLLISDDGAGFVLDVGGKPSFDALKEALADGLIDKIEGIWVTHLHNDHTQFVAEAQREFGCPVYGVAEVADGIERPTEFYTPYLSANAVDAVTTMKDGETLKWKEYNFTARYFPGQMYDHGALLVERPGHEAVFFVGDSFSPSGIDDYCLMNQNLLGEDEGYLHCFGIVRKELPEKCWLVNQHIPHLFRFNTAELDTLEGRFRERIGMIAEFVPWDDPNYAVDEQWAWFAPYGSEVSPGTVVELGIELSNHSHSLRTFEITLHAPAGIEVKTALTATLGARQTQRVPFTATISKSAPPGVLVITASIKTEGMDLPEWCAGLVKIRSEAESVRILNTPDSVAARVAQLNLMIERIEGMASNWPLGSPEYQRSIRKARDSWAEYAPSERALRSQFAQAGVVLDEDYYRSQLELLEAFSRQWQQIEDTIANNP